MVKMVIWPTLITKNPCVGVEGLFALTDQLEARLANPSSTSRAARSSVVESLHDLAGLDKSRNASVFSKRGGLHR